MEAPTGALALWTARILSGRTLPGREKCSIITRRMVSWRFCHVKHWLMGISPISIRLPEGQLRTTASLWPATALFFRLLVRLPSCEPSWRTLERVSAVLASLHFGCKRLLPLDNSLPTCFHSRIIEIRACDSTAGGHSEICGAPHWLPPGALPHERKKWSDAMFLLFADVCIILHVMAVSMSECGESHDQSSAGGDMLPD